MAGERQPGGAGSTIVFAESPTEDMLASTLDGGLTIQAQRHTAWIKPENIKTAHSLAATQGISVVKAHAKQQAKEMIRELRAKGLEKEKVAYDALNPALQA